MRKRLRELGISIGRLPPGKHNAVTDVPGVLVGHSTLIYDEPRIARTGVTVILPREGAIWKDHTFAATHTLNGSGEMTGVHWIAESGMLTSPIAITNTAQVGTVHEALNSYAYEFGWTDVWELPVVAETWDGWLNDMAAFHVAKDHVYQAIESARSGPVAEGNVGGGTGMICHEFKGGIGTASRMIASPSGTYTVGALVQANYGAREDLRVDGVPVGREITIEKVPSGRAEPPGGSSIIVILATDAPLVHSQCKRLAQRATIGLARVGGMGHHGSGDIFLAFATGNQLVKDTQKPYVLQMLPNDQLNGFFLGVVEAAEEAILNALTAAETMTGLKGRIAHELPLDELQRIMERKRL
ncbi:MAG: P1 family peptidase [Chloroflexi bacterium]|nr:P1 family peptidase [Chloroflexota bacterium]